MVRVYEPIVRATPEEIVAEQRKELSRIGSVRRLPGLKLYEYDLTTGEVREADVQTEATLKLEGPVGRTGKVDARELCLYVQALNRENAARKFREMIRRKSVQNKILKKL
jgi:hypothetical protein